MTTDEIERQLADLRRELAETEAKLPEIERELAPANGALEAAQRAYDEVGQAWLKARAAVGEGTPVYEGQTWRPQTAEQAEQARETVRLAEAARTVTEEELGKALVKRSGIDKRRGDLVMHARYLAGQIEQTEALLAKAQAEAERTERERSGVLARIRERLGT